MSPALLALAVAAATPPSPPAPPRAPALTRAPELVEPSEPLYPPDLAAAGVTGTVGLALVLDERGEVVAARVTEPSGHPALDAAALHAATQLRFTPAELDGKPASVELAYRYTFALHPASPPEAAGPSPPPAPAPARPGYEAVVRGERPEPTVRAVGAAEVRQLAGTQGDLLKVLQDFPGVARAPFGLGLLVVRGSAPQDTRVYVDGIEIPLLFHFGGLTSVVSSDAVAGLEFYPGNFGAAHGRALGGSVEVTTRAPRRELHGVAKLDLFDGSALVEAPLGEGAVLLSARRSWVDAVLALVLPSVAPDTARDLTVAPRYYDYQARLVHPLLGGEASVSAFGADDALELLRQGDEAARPTFRWRTSFHRVAARFRRTLGAGLALDATLAAGHDDVEVIQGDNASVRTTVDSLTLRDALTWRASPSLAVEVGVDALVRRFDYAIDAPPFRAPGTLTGLFGDVAALVGERARGGWWSPAVYVEATWQAAPRLRLVPGLRLDFDSRVGGAQGWLDPRLAAYWDVAPGTTLVAAAGLYGEPPPPQDTTRTVGNPALGVQRARQVSLGVKQALPGEARLEVTAFHKALRDLVTDTRAASASGDALKLSNAGLGEAWGLETLLRRELGDGLVGWLAWTWSRSLRRDDPTIPGYPTWHPFAFDQTHIFTLVLSYPVGAWTLGTRLRAVTGNPYTPPVGGVLDADAGSYVCLPAPRRFSARLPPFFQADVRVDRRWSFARWGLAAYLDLQNVTNRTNAELSFPSYDCSQQASLSGLPIFPSFGVRAEW